MIYREAARYLEDAAGTLRNRIYNSGPSKSQDLRQLKQIYALSCETIRHKTALTHIINSSQMLLKERKLTLNVALVMVYDLLLGQGRLNCGKCFEKDAVLRHKTRLHGELVKYKLKHPQLAETSNSDEPPVRWLRTNLMISNDQATLDLFKRLQLTEVSAWQKVSTKNWHRDSFIPNLFAIHPSISMNKLPEYREGKIIVQDRASCIPVTLMNPEPKGVYIDACAAPGNKTSQLAAVSRKVTAFERDPKRAKTLAKMLETAKLSDRVDIQIKDFTHYEPTDEYIDGLIVDPSCSGSGIFRSTTTTPERLQKLSEFQYLIMLHALKFNAGKVVYSTCSIHPEEDENVIQKLLDTPEVSMKWELANKADSLPKWPRRGLEKDLSENNFDSCIRVEPRTDGGIGFFAACFVRKST